MSQTAPTEAAVVAAKKIIREQAQKSSGGDCKKSGFWAE